MIKSVNNYPVSQIFDIEVGVVYAVPKYQREYTWSKNQWENLFDDVLENDFGYFLGSIICINQTNDSLTTPQLEVVDGQQRLTTLSLLFAAIYDALNSKDDQLNYAKIVELTNLKHRLVLKKDESKPRVVPQIQNNNYADYQGVLSQLEILEPHDFPSYSGRRKIVRAYRYFQDRIKLLTEGQGNQIGSIMSFLEKVNKASLVKIEVSSHTDAYILFESLNNRGMPLSAIDLIKNKLLARLETIEPGKIDYYFDRWTKLLEYLGDDYSIQERFFRQYYNAFRDELKSIYQVPVATRSNLIQIYEKLIERNPKDCLEQISTAGQQYALILLRRQDETIRQLEKSLKDLERIQGAPSYLLVLYLFTRKEQLKLDITQLDKILHLLVCFFVRRNLTDTPPTRDLTRLFMAIIEQLTGQTGDAIVDTIFDRLLTISASDETFRQKLEGSIYEENSGVTRFILCALAEQEMTRETWVDLWRFESNQFVWTIEHIFPQGENIPTPWVAMIADGDTQKAKELQQSHVHKLGNLTISGFNSSLSNKSFIDKRDRTDKQGRSVGYKNGLKFNEELSQAEKWSIPQIEARTSKLVDRALVLFKLARGGA
jgi:uncharacterized protein with ParB-like and HNH nuclease domain